MRNYYKKKSIGKILGIITVVVILVGISVFVLYKKENVEEEEMIGVYVVDKEVAAGDEVYGTVRLQQVEQSYIGSLPDNVIVGDGKQLYYKINLNKGVILTEDMVQKNTKLTNDMRLHNFSYVELNNMISKGDYVDVRINFDDGSDYIVLSKKRVEGVSVYDSESGTDNELWINVSEEEILRMSSAAYDCATKENCRLYAVKYISELQTKAYVTYPVNQIVAALIQNDPNILEQAAQILDDNLRDQIDGLSNGNSHTQSSGVSKDEEKDTIEGSDSSYMDDTLENDGQSFVPDDDNSLVYDVEDDKEIQYLD